MPDDRVLDASAVLALIREEAGAEQVESRLTSGVISVVNTAEIAERLARDGVSRQTTERMIAQLEIEHVSPGFEDAMIAGAMAVQTRGVGLSLGDRFCLALARRRGVPALTADRRWKEIAGKVGVEVELIR